MSVEKWWNEICGRGKQEKPREKPTQTPFRPPRNPHGGTVTRTRDPSGGRRASNRLRHETALFCSYNLYNENDFYEDTGLYKFAHFTPLEGGYVAQAVRRSPPTAAVPSSRLVRKMWVSW